jgi:hypothetical protein
VQSQLDELSEVLDEAAAVAKTASSAPATSHPTHVRSSSTEGNHRVTEILFCGE